MRDKTKVITIAALVIAIIGLSIGFAAFSSTLNITTGASVSPEDGNFIVKFSKLNDELDETDVAPSTGTGDSARINNTNISNPVISNLSAQFTQPGDVVEYTFYVRNMGKYDAHLTDVRFNKTGGEFKTCTATGDNPVSNTIKDDICRAIKFTVTLENSPSNISLTSTSDYANDVNVDYIVNKSSTPNTGTTNSKMVKVRIEYPSNAPHADGSFTVEFGSVEMIFATLAGYIPPVQEATSDTENTCVVTNHKSFGSTCTLSQDNDSSGTVTKGDKVTCGTESFYVIENPSNGTTKMLAEWNLNISELGDIEDLDGVPYSYTYCESTVGYQDEHVRGYLGDEPDASLLPYTYTLNVEFEGEQMSVPWPYGTVKFDRVTEGDYGYWAPGGFLNTSTYTENNNGGYPAYVYDNNATLKTFVDTYVGYLNSQISGANATGRLINTAELEALGCSQNDYTCSSSPSWVYQTSYWSGSADDYDDVEGVDSNGDFRGNYFDRYNYGVRPVITISSSVIQAS